jgi:hypothetical protein
LSQPFESGDLLINIDRKSYDPGIFLSESPMGEGNNSCHKNTRKIERHTSKKVLARQKRYLFYAQRCCR